MSLISSVQLEACLVLSKQQEGLGVKVKEALDIIYSALEQYGEEKISLSFNGGKDCTVLLHLYAVALHNWRSLRTSSSIQNQVNGSKPGFSSSADADAYPKNIPALYIFPPSPFSKLEQFISDSEKAYNLSLFRQSGVPGMKEALRVYKDVFPNVEAILIGIRKTDPHGGKLSVSNPTDPDWPKFMRVHPILQWSYSDVWSFLRSLNVPYCSLYNTGYTSLGSTYNTFPNPALLTDQSDADTATSSTHYRPAYELEDETLERAGRGPSIPSSHTATGQESIAVSVSHSLVLPLPVPPSSALPTPSPEKDERTGLIKITN